MLTSLATLAAIIHLCIYGCRIGTQTAGYTSRGFWKWVVQYAVFLLGLGTGARLIGDPQISMATCAFYGAGVMAGTLLIALPGALFGYCLGRIFRPKPFRWAVIQQDGDLPDYYLSIHGELTPLMTGSEVVRQVNAGLSLDTPIRTQSSEQWGVVRDWVAK